MNEQEKLQVLTDAYNYCVSTGKARTKREFAELIGVHHTTISSAFNARGSYLTDSLVAKAAAIMDGAAPQTQSKDTLLVIPTGARGGTLGDFAVSVSEYDCERIVSPIRGADYAIQVTGDSMSPEYPSGSHIIIKKVNEEAFIEWGKVYVLDTENGAIIKQIRKTESPDHVECVSLNPAYQPFQVDCKYIRGWYRVLMVLALK